MLNLEENKRIAARYFEEFWNYGVKKHLASRIPKEKLALAEARCLWRSYGTMNLWNSL